MKMNFWVRVAVLQVLFTILVVYLALVQNTEPNNGLPEKFQLSAREGKIAHVVKESSVSKGSQPLSLYLRNDPYRYVYLSKSGRVGDVQRILLAAHRRGQVVKLLCDTYYSAREFDDGPTARCFEVAVADEIIQSYQDVQEAWRNNATLGLYFAVGMVIWSVFIVALAYHQGGFRKTH